jgi:hypothetical protein
MTIRDKLQPLCEKALADNEDSYRGSDWFHLSDDEETVFAIDRRRYPVLVVAWQAYEAFCGLIDPEVAGLDDESIEGERAQYPELFVDGEISDSGFQKLAAAWCGVSNREAHAMYCKTDFWNIRGGIVHYRDEV